MGDMEHLATIEHLLSSPIPACMSSRVSQRILDKGVVFERHGSLAWPACAANEKVVQRVESLRNLREMVLPRHSAFLKLLKGLLAIQPEQRLSADAALGDLFLTSSSI